MDACIKARPNMITTLDSFRDTLEDLGGGPASPIQRRVRSLSAEIVCGEAANSCVALQ